MTDTTEQIASLAETVALWRLQEYTESASDIMPEDVRGEVEDVSVSSFTIYVLTTMAEEVSVIFPQRWSRGKLLYMYIRYASVVWVSIHLGRDFRNYFVIKPSFCKFMYIAHSGVRVVMALTCNFSLGLCLAALLQVQGIYVIAILVLSCGMPLVNNAYNLLSTYQYPAEEPPPLQAELGYPCSIPSVEQYAKSTSVRAQVNVRDHLNLTTTTLLAILGVATLIVRYKGQSGRLIQVIRRDGGLHYLSIIAMRLCAAIFYNHAVLKPAELDRSEHFFVIAMYTHSLIPILAQRLLINMRKVDYMGSQPVASKLLFAPPAPGSEEDVENSQDSLELGPQGHTGHPQDPESGGSSKPRGVSADTCKEG